MKRSQRGYILVQALLLVAGLLAVLAILMNNQRTSMQTLEYRLQQRRADAAANAALQQGIGTLAAANINIVTQNDAWAELGNAGDEEYDMSDGSTFRMQIVDTGSMIDLNTATQAQLTDLPLDPDQIDSLLDWLQTSTTPRADGAKSDYYNSLTQPYNAKLGQLDTLDELLLIKNWTAQTLYQPPVDPTNQLDWPNDKLGNKLPLAALVTIHSGAPDTQASGAARINFDTTRVTATQLRQLGLNRFTASQIAGHAFTSYSSLFAVRGMNLTYAGELLNVATFSTTTTTTGKFNINTASAAALETIPSMTSDVANAIVQQQTSGYETLGAVANLAGFTTRSLGAIADSLTIGSNTWIVRAYGQNGSASTAIEAVVGMRSNQIQVISCNRLHTVQIPSWWDWDQQTTSNVQAGTTTQ